MKEERAEKFLCEVERIRQRMKEPLVRVEKPRSEFPELVVRVPDSWPHIKLCPFYDAHLDSPGHDAEKFGRDFAWVKREPHVLTFDGGDFYENITPATAAKFGQTRLTPEEQILHATEVLADIRHKLLFKLLGNHEDRTETVSGMSSAKRLADNLNLPYFPDYCFCTIAWRGNKFHLLAHHGSGAATTPGAQRNAARKDMPWTKADIYWTGHLHQPMADAVYQTDYDQRTGRMVERSALVIISPSYLKYFNSYAAKKRMAPGLKGFTGVTLQEDGRMDLSIHVNGERL